MDLEAQHRRAWPRWLQERASPRNHHPRFRVPRYSRQCPILVNASDDSPWLIETGKWSRSRGLVARLLLHLRKPITGYRLRLKLLVIAKRAGYCWLAWSRAPRQPRVVHCPAFPEHRLRSALRPSARTLLEAWWSRGFQRELSVEPAAIGWIHLLRMSSTPPPIRFVPAEESARLAAAGLPVGGAATGGNAHRVVQVPS